MAVNEIHIDAAPERVFEVLTSGHRYAEWVVGAKEIRSVDDDWPQPGSKIHHTVGAGPVEIEDNTEVVEYEPPHRILLEARARPVGTARIELAVEPDGPGSRVRMTEDMVDTSDVVDSLADAAIKSRNSEALRRLREMCEEGGRHDGGDRSDSDDATTATRQG